MPETTNKLESSSYRSQKATIASLSLLEKLDTIPALLTVFGNVITALFTGAVRGKDKKPSAGLYKYVMLTAIRTLCRRMSVRQQHYISAPTDDAYLAACKKYHQEPKSEVLSDGTRAHWIGSSSAKSLIINFHGGGYTLPPSPEMYWFFFQITAYLRARGKDVSCLFLSYDLAPGRTYPRQLQQAAMLLNHVLAPSSPQGGLAIPPQNIILTGDSAGANLATALLSHISHPHPGKDGVDVPRVELPSGKGRLKGAVLISPWVSFSLADDSFARNRLKDCIDPRAGTQWSSAFVGAPWPHTDKNDNYNEARIAPESWWTDLQVDEVFIVAGEEEVLVDGIKDFEGKLRKGLGKDRVQMLIVPGEYHDQPSLDLQFGYKEKDEGEQAKAIKGWIASKL